MFEFYRKERVSVTASTGMNGSCIVKALVEGGSKVRAVLHDRRSNEFTKLAPRWRART